MTYFYVVIKYNVYLRHTKTLRTMKRIQTIMILFFLLPGMIRINAQTAAEIEKANKACKPVFLVAYNTNGADVDKAVNIANTAKKALKVSSVVIKLNTSDAANHALVTKYRLAGAPLPLILVLDKNGNASGGFELKDATPEKLVDIIPSPKYSEVIQALSEGKSVYLVAYKESMTSKKNILDNCALACRKMDNKSITVMVSMDDKNETKFLKSLACNLTSKEPVTYVVNSSGQVTGTFNGITDVNNLVASAKKAASKGCGTNCAPGACK